MTPHGLTAQVVAKHDRDLAEPDGWAAPLKLPLVASRIGYAGAAVIGALILDGLMMYAILPVANPLMVDMTPRGAFIVGHILYGLTFGLVAFALLRPSGAAPTLRRESAL